MNQPLKILLVDDNPDDRALVMRALSREFPGVHVEQVKDAQGLAQALDRGGFDLVSTDYQLKWTDGLAILRAVKASRPDCPVIMFTGTGSEEIAVEAMKAGLDDYVLKSPKHYIRLPGAVKKALERAKAVAERKRAEEDLRRSHRELRMLAGRLQEAQEAERKHVAREIHDELGQTLTAMKLDLGWLGKRLAAEGGPAPQAKALEKVRSLARLVDGAMDSMKRVAAALRPRVLDDLGLAAALEWQSSEFQARTGIRCELHISPAVKAMQIDPTCATALFRICQELLTNTSRHAQASKVSIALTQKERALVLNVHDNGKGISEQEIKQSPSFGLLGIRERAALLGGACEIHGTPGQGTTVVVKLPMPPSPTPHNG